MNRGLLVTLVTTGLCACGGSVTTDGSGKDPVDLVADICAHLAALHCSSIDTQQCVQQGDQFAADAEKAGCNAQLQQYLSCLDAAAVSCDLTSNPCPSEMANLDACTPGTGQCSISGGGGASGAAGTSSVATCSIGCPDVAATCTGSSPGAPLYCVCEGGVRDGNSFQTADCGSSLGAALDAACR